MNSSSAAVPRAPRPWLDRLGALGSAACALHCAAAPLVFVLIPTLDAGAWFGEEWEIALVSVVTAIALAATVVGQRRHGGRAGLLLMLGGLATLWSGVLVPAFHHELRWHVPVMSVGGALVALGHVANLTRARRHAAAGCCAA